MTNSNHNCTLPLQMAPNYEPHVWLVLNLCNPNVWLAHADTYMYCPGNGSKYQQNLLCSLCCTRFCLHY